ncbi:TonB-dependent receptor [Sphingomonas sp. NFR04]|uniref:TonB-dependent receptor n=1 Tax=Sphingomonas sp. NFR04 TaxID=1566283 RepID=UPI0008E3826C|nr:TonB-dependent receptor [Sphingomonas sp. NFR04]SFJ70417.1 TonB-dependent receptor [Sphingomonas sp. NFR04]
MSVQSIKQAARTGSVFVGTSIAALACGLAAPAYAQAGTASPDAAVQQAGTQSGTTQPSGDQNSAAGAAPADGSTEIVVTGVRASLQSAQNIKRNADQVVDSIVAEDIGKLPDRNIAEALQRISGIQIQRNYGEGSAVAIRGLTQVRTELNGRDIFTASGTNNALTLEDVPSELLAGIDVYKNPSADLIEDQLSGTINFRTRKPFDFDGFKISGSVSNTYNDLVRESQPSASLLVSDRWNTGIGEIGVLVSASYQKSSFRQDTISTEPFYTLDPTNATDAATLASLGRTGSVTTLPHGTGIGEAYGDRRRFGIDASLQWRPTDTLELTGEVFRNDYKFRFDDYSYFAYTSGASITPQPGAAFAYAPNGDFQSGTFVDLPIGANTSLGTRHSVTTDYSLNGKWKPTANLTITADAQYVDSTTDSLRSIIGLNGTATTLTQDISGKIPAFQITSAAGLTNVGTYNGAFYLDNMNNSHGEDKTGRLDAEYRFDGSILRSIKAGFRYADRSNRYSDTGYRYIGLSTVPSTLEVVDFSDFFRGDADLFGNALLFNRNTTLSYDATRAALGVATAVPYLPSGTNTESQKTYTGYAAAFFKADQLAVPIDGNIGVRVIRTNIDVSGFYQQYGLVTAPDGTQSTVTDPTVSPITNSTSYTSVLPSLNLRAHLNDKLQLRFAASKNIARPTFDQLNPSLNITEPGAAQLNQEHVTSGGNPYLKPMKSTNFDVSLEWYFSRTGSLTAAGFYKNISNYIQTGISTRDVTFDDGVTARYSVTSYSNAATAKVKGVEVAYQQFFDFLPGALKGLGFQGNFTYVDSQAPSPATAGPVRNVSLEGLSKYNYNLVGLYEHGLLSARVAYNWRSEFLVTTSGNGTGNLPVFEKPFGQLDASVTVNVNPHFALTANAVNLLNTMTSTYYGIETRPRDAVINDRKFTIVGRITF